MYPISEAAALAFGKEPCAECVIPEQKSAVSMAVGIRIAERGGTYIISIPESGLDRITVEENPVGQNAISTEEAQTELSRILSEEACADFMMRYEIDGWAQDSYRIPEVICDADDLYMSSRFIGDNWHIVIRPQKSYGEEKEIRWQATEYDFRREKDESVDKIKRCSGIYAETAAVEDHSKAAKLFERDYNLMTLSVYRAEGMNTAVFRYKEDTRPRTAVLHIGERDTGTVLNGYQDSQKRGIYCCVISDEELGYIVAGRIPDLVF
jgi:hypothetical protein